MCAGFYSFGQDTIYVNDESMGGISKYRARDSIYADLKKKQLHLYGEAYVETEEMNLKAGYILVDMEKEEVTATYVLDEEGRLIEKPLFTMGGDEAEANTLKYNLRTGKAYIEAVKIVQDEMYLHMGRAKRQANEEIHFVEGRFTTCDLDEPHYHFQLSRGVMIPDKRIVTGPMNLYIAGVPTPLGLPFSYIPQKDQNERTHGLLFPEIVPISNYGFGLNNLGYYIPINDRLQTSVYGTIYSRGSWGLRNVTEYARRYGYTGSFDVSYYQYKSGFPTNNRLNNVDLKWVHRKDAKSNPKWNFNTNINFNSSNNSKNNLDPVNQNYFKNTLMSDINLNRSFPGKPYQLSAKIALSQNSQTRNIALTSPIVNFSTSQFFPLKKLLKAEIFQRLGIIYNIEGQNKSTFEDVLLRDGKYAEIGNQFMYGMRQNLTVQTTGGVFKNVLKLTPSINYSTNLNFQQIRKVYDPVLNNAVNDTVRQAGLAHTLSFNMAATTALYTYYRFVGKNKPIMRHVLTPNVSFSYRPLLTKNLEANVGPNQEKLVYSPYSNSVYAYTATKDQALINFGINNSFELKRKSDKDTVTGFQKIRIIDALSLTGNYDIMKESMNLSDINVNIRISPFKWMNIVGTTSYSFYGWDAVTNASLPDFALKSNSKLGRTMNNAITTTFTITSRESREKIEENKEVVAENWQADYDYFYLHPERIIDYRIPWKVNVSHVFNLNRNINKTVTDNEEFRQVHTVNVDTDISITKRWKLGAVVNIDLKTKKVTNGYFTLNRDMHCWALSFRWTPIGFNKSFLLTIRNTSSIFKDAKLDFRKPPAFL
ncbi:LPS-assembly protein LptD [Crocinitomicaceae bacterium CZZ-1]|uniref:LPS-assembly protein LptD n=1 Tax=Taishania pollutisoli TaxID=2766479 RepID=A0A8J6P9D0_9FLAO|nr:putative LPS assembly protein LptD [Taishania pollutisoli]MBC9812601.1 LPS-assembly protein LptD [Taishania pollutisoli]MBX2949239.1 LPS-assembly protein LptD [Crocinitomicaceae bacterium]NGF77113.1 LPS-assembly protein LptD [Fluviicola sp. SGL-29]